jgi:hypothetical protein
VILSDRKVFIAIGISLTVVGALLFLTHSFLKVVTGHSLDTYDTRIGPVSYISVLVGSVVFLAAVIFAVALRFIDWYTLRRQAARFNVTPNNRSKGHDA